MPEGNPMLSEVWIPRVGERVPCVIVNVSDDLQISFNQTGTEIWTMPLGDFLATYYWLPPLTNRSFLGGRNVPFRVLYVEVGFVGYFEISSGVTNWMRLNDFIERFHPTRHPMPEPTTQILGIARNGLNQTIPTAVREYRYSLFVRPQVSEGTPQNEQPAISMGSRIIDLDMNLRIPRIPEEYQYFTEKTKQALVLSGTSLSEVPSKTIWDHLLEN